MANTLVATSSALAFEQHLLTEPTVELSAPQAPAQTTTTQTAVRSPLLCLPTELHLLIMARLDPVDRTVLGLTSKQFYSTYRMTLPRILPSSNYPSLPPQSDTRMPVSLRAGRQGRNKLEHCFNKHIAGAAPCRFCKVERCQLWRHLDELFPSKEWEFCGVRERFAPRVVGEVHSEECWRSCPPMPRRCGRHGSVAVAKLEEMSRL